MFRYADFWLGHGPWTRVDLNDGVRCHPNREAFLSVHLFENAAPTPHEPMLMGPFFDIDRAGHLDEALEDLRKITQSLLDLGLSAERLCINFSGSKGFHIVASRWAFGIEPSTELNLRIGILCETIASMAGATIDHKVYSKRRVIRVPGSVHGKSKMVAVPLSASQALSISIDEVIRLASSATPDPRPLSRYFRQHDLSPIASQLWQDCLDVPLTMDRDSRASFIIKDSPPPCVLDLMDNGCKEEGGFNSGAMMIACAAKEQGFGIDSALQMTDAYACHTKEGVSSKKGRELNHNAASACQGIYNNRGSFFSCQAMRKTGAFCAHGDCKHVSHEREALDVSLGIQETFVSALSKDVIDKEQVLVLSGAVSACAKLPLNAPAKIKISCTLNAGSNACGNCPVPKAAGGVLSILDNPKAVLSSVYPNKNPSVFRTFGVPKGCPDDTKHYDILESVSVTIVEATPILEDEWRTNRFYVATHDVSPCEHYEFVSKTVSHPYTHDVVHYCASLKRLSRQWEDPVDQRVIDDIHATGVLAGDPWEVLWNLHASFEGQVHTIRNRRLQALATMLPWYSVLEYTRHNGRIERGALHITSFGDSGQGKSDLITRFIEWLGLGRILSGEYASTAGLVAGVDKFGGGSVTRFGELVRAHRELRCLDEWHGAHPDIRAALSMVLSSGRAVITKMSGHSEAPALLRIIFVANPVNKLGNSKKMIECGHPIEWIGNIWPNPEDVRRQDYVIGFLAKELNLFDDPPTRQEVLLSKEQAQALCHLAWQLKPSQVVISKETDESARGCAKQLSHMYARSIPLVEPGDLQQKIERIAIAIAAQLASYQGSSLCVSPMHVDAAFTLLQNLYNSEDLAFDQFSEMSGQIEMTEEVAHKVYMGLRSALGTTLTRFKLGDALTYLASAKVTAFTVKSMVDIVPGMDAEIAAKFSMHLLQSGWMTAYGAAIKVTEAGSAGLKMAAVIHEEINQARRKHQSDIIPLDLLDDIAQLKNRPF